jgi:hypothetical protein
MKSALLLFVCLSFAALHSASAAVDIDTCYDNCFTIEALCPGLHTSCNATCAVNATFAHGCVGDMTELVYSMNATNNSFVLDHSCAYFPSSCFTDFGSKLLSMLPLLGNALRPSGPVETALEEGQVPLVSMNPVTGEVHVYAKAAEPTDFDRWNQFWDSLS